jgi:hypothetical protein
MNHIFHYLKFLAISFLFYLCILLLIIAPFFGDTFTDTELKNISIILIIPIVFASHFLLKKGYDNSKQIQLENPTQHTHNIRLTVLRISILVPIYFTFAMGDWLESAEGGLILMEWMIFTFPLMIIGLVFVITTIKRYKYSLDIKHASLAGLYILIWTSLLSLFYYLISNHVYFLGIYF